MLDGGPRAWFLGHLGSDLACEFMFGQNLEANLDGAAGLEYASDWIICSISCDDIFFLYTSLGLLTNGC